MDRFSLFLLVLVCSSIEINQGTINNAADRIKQHVTTSIHESLQKSFSQRNISASSDAELQKLSEELLSNDTNTDRVLVEIQNKTSPYTLEDKAYKRLFKAQPLLHPYSYQAWNSTTIKKMVMVFNFYDWNSLIDEYDGERERIEENEFMDVIMETPVMRHLMNYLELKGYVSSTPKQQREYIKTLWFTLFSRGKGQGRTSGFRHVFMSDLKNGRLSGYHNWIYFGAEEMTNRVNYLGYMKYLEIPNKRAILKFHFKQYKNINPVETNMFIGVSPELQMSLYTLCFVTRADQDCKLKLGGHDVNIVTQSVMFKNKKLIGCAYPEI